ncbi:MAG TPA: DUF2244 domain-containing protein [Rhizomicrobium sp.]|jgi:uncharacterized membrane protein|nr:DUF2244 domain-containing protein [Rhizomicrobium sp.]
MSADNHPVLFDQTLRPNPPMNIGALVFVATAVATINLAFGLYFVLRGAWPVTPFMGLDAILLAWAFRASFRTARCYERICLTPTMLRVEHHPARGRPIRSEFNPYWVRVDFGEAPGRGRSLALASHGLFVQIGAFLPPAQKLSVAQGLTAALARSRQTNFD